MSAAGQGRGPDPPDREPRTRRPNRVRVLRFEYDLPLIWKLVFCAATVPGLPAGRDHPLHQRWAGRSPDLGRSSWFDPLLRRFEVSGPDLSRKNLFLIAMLAGALAVPYCLLAAPLDVALPPLVAPGRRARRPAGSSAGTSTPWRSWPCWRCVWILVPLGVCLRGVFRAGATNSQGPAGRAGGPEPSGSLADGRERPLPVADASRPCSRGSLSSSGGSTGSPWCGRSCPTTGWPSIGVPTCWEGSRPIVPVACLGAAIFWWAYLELKRLHAYPLLRRRTDLITLERDLPARGVPVEASHPQAECPVPPVRRPARVSGHDPDLEEPAPGRAGRLGGRRAGRLRLGGGLASIHPHARGPGVRPAGRGRVHELPALAALLPGPLPVALEIVAPPLPPDLPPAHGRGVRPDPPPGGRQVRPVPPDLAPRRHGPRDPAPAVPPRARAGRRHRARPAAAPGGPPRGGRARLRDRRSRKPSRSSRTPASARWSSWPGPAARWRRPTAARSPARRGSPAASPSTGEAGGLDPATLRWLAMAEELLALRIVYLVSQFAAPLRSMSAQLIYGPILLLLAVAWYPVPSPAADVDHDLGVHRRRGPGDPDRPPPDRTQRLRQPGLPDRPQRASRSIRPSSRTCSPTPCPSSASS